MNNVHVHEEVDAALRSGKAVVALESAVVTVGLPREPIDRTPAGLTGQWDPGAAVNVQVARLLGGAVRKAGAVPAMTAVIGGVLHIGLNDDQLAALADDSEAGKTSMGDLAATMASRRTAGTTVSATLTACTLPQAGPIRFFATGGIGGVHRHWTRRLDVSADLRALACTPVCVVCSGVKSILDVPATLEALEALAVPMASYQTPWFPLFLSLGVPAIPASIRVDDAAEVVRLCRTHWETLGRSGGIVVANPVPAEFALPWEDVDRHIRVIEAGSARIADECGARTPTLLSELARQTAGRSIDANIALLCGNAELASRIAVTACEDA